MVLPRHLVYVCGFSVQENESKQAWGSEGNARTLDGLGNGEVARGKPFLNRNNASRQHTRRRAPRHTREGDTLCAVMKKCVQTEKTHTTEEIK